MHPLLFFVFTGLCGFFHPFSATFLQLSPHSAAIITGRQTNVRCGILVSRKEVSDTTEKQIDTANAVVKNSFGGLTAGEQIAGALSQTDVSETDMLAWLRDAAFGSAVVQLAREYAGIYAAEIWQQLLTLARDGNIQAIKLYFELWKDVRANPALGFAAAEASPEMMALRANIFRQEQDG